VQVARFDPAKGIPTVIDSYAEFRRQCEKKGITETPQLVVYVPSPCSPVPCSWLTNAAAETARLMIRTPA
jgi:hypothetical protein